MMLSDFKRLSKYKMCIKIDLQKARDMINREFLCHMLFITGFLNSRITLIYECIITPFSILVEGSPHGFTHSNKALRQGDPLSLFILYYYGVFIFEIRRQFITRLFKAYLQCSNPQGYLKPIYSIQPCVSHLLYADDVMFLLEATVQNVKECTRIFDDLKTEIYYGLQLNKVKSKVYSADNLKTSNKFYKF